MSPKYRNPNHQSYAKNGNYMRAANFTNTKLV